MATREQQGESEQPHVRQTQRIRLTNPWNLSSRTSFRYSVALIRMLQTQANHPLLATFQRKTLRLWNCRGLIPMKPKNSNLLLIRRLQPDQSLAHASHRPLMTRKPISSTPINLCRLLPQEIPADDHVLAPTNSLLWMNSPKQIFLQHHRDQRPGKFQTTNFRNRLSRTENPYRRSMKTLRLARTQIAIMDWQTPTIFQPSMIALHARLLVAAARVRTIRANALSLKSCDLS